MNERKWQQSIHGGPRMDVKRGWQLLLYRSVDGIGAIKIPRLFLARKSEVGTQADTFVAGLNQAIVCRSTPGSSHDLQFTPPIRCSTQQYFFSTP